MKFKTQLCGLFLAISTFQLAAQNLSVIRHSLYPQVTTERFYRLEFDKTNNLWAGSEKGALFYYKNNTWTKVYSPTQDQISDIHFDDNGGMWLGTKTSEIYYRSPNGNWNTYTNFSTQASSNWTWLIKSTGQFVYFATENELLEFNGSTWSKFNVTTTPALPSNNIIDMAVDRYGELYVLFNEGIYHIGKKGISKEFTLVTKDSYGVQSISFDRNNTLYGATQYGIAQFEKMSTNTYRLTIFQKSIFDIVGGICLTIDKNKNYWSSIARNGGMGLGRYDGKKYYAYFNEETIPRVIYDIELDPTDSSKIWITGNAGIVSEVSLNKKVNTDDDNISLLESDIELKKLDNRMIQVFCHDINIKSPVRANIYNIQGQLMTTQNLQYGLNTIDISLMTSGMYVLDVSASTPKRLVHKFIIAD